MRREADEDEVGGIGKPQKFIDLHRASQDADLEFVATVATGGRVKFLSAV